jgi:hypothetical protein
MLALRQQVHNPHLLRMHLSVQRCEQIMKGDQSGYQQQHFLILTMLSRRTTRLPASSERLCCGLAIGTMADDLQLAEATQPLSFAEFLERMKDARAADLVKSIKM